MKRPKRIIKLSLKNLINRKIKYKDYNEEIISIIIKLDEPNEFNGIITKESFIYNICNIDSNTNKVAWINIGISNVEIMVNRHYYPIEQIVFTK